VKKLYFLSFIVFLIVSCNKETILEQGTVQGIVVDKTTNVGIAGATVYLLTHEPSGGFGGGGGSTQIDFTTSAVDGSFFFQFDYDNSLAYTCAATQDQYFDYGDEFPVLEEIKEGNNVEVKLQPKGYLTIHFANIPPSTASDIFGINGGVTDTFYGDNVDTIVTYDVDGNFSNVLHWAVGYGLTNSDTIYCPSFDTTYFELLY